MTLLVLALLLAKVDGTQLAAFSSGILAVAALVRSVTTDPRATRIAERKENQEYRREIDELYVQKREAENREREANRRIDKQERELDEAKHYIARLTGELDVAQAKIDELEGQVRHWRMIVGDIRGNRRRFPEDS